MTSQVNSPTNDLEKNKRPSSPQAQLDDEPVTKIAKLQDGPDPTNVPNNNDQNKTVQEANDTGAVNSNRKNSTEVTLISLLQADEKNQQKADNLTNNDEVLSCKLKKHQDLVSVTVNDQDDTVDLTKEKEVPSTSHTQKTSFEHCGLCNSLMQVESAILLGCLHSYCTKCILKREHFKWHSSSHFSENRNSSPSANLSHQPTIEEIPDSAFESLDSLKKFLFDQKENFGKMVIKCQLCDCNTRAKVLMKNYFINSIKPPDSCIEKTDRKSCTNCDEKECAIEFCEECSEYLCRECANAHRRVKLTKDHTLKKLEVPIDEQVIIEKSLKHRYCQIHQGEELKLYCHTCDVLTCRDCQLDSHRSHKYSFVEEAAKTHQNIFEAMRQKFLEKKHFLKQASSSINQHMVLLSKAKNKAEGEIVDFHSRLQEALTAKCQAFIDKLQEISSVRYNKLNNQITCTNRLSEAVDHCISFIDFSCQKQNSLALLSTKKMILEYMTAVMKQKFTTNPVTGSDVVFIPEENNFKSLLTKLGVLKWSTDSNTNPLINCGVWQGQSTMPCSSPQSFPQYPNRVGRMPSYAIHHRPVLATSFTAHKKSMASVRPNNVMGAMLSPNTSCSVGRFPTVVSRASALNASQSRSFVGTPPQHSSITTAKPIQPMPQQNITGASNNLIVLEKPPHMVPSHLSSVGSTGLSRSAAISSSPESLIRTTNLSTTTNKAGLVSNKSSNELKPFVMNVVGNYEPSLDQQLLQRRMSRHHSMEAPSFVRQPSLEAISKPLFDNVVAEPTPPQLALKRKTPELSANSAITSTAASTRHSMETQNFVKQTSLEATQKPLLNDVVARTDEPALPQLASKPKAPEVLANSAVSSDSATISSSSSCHIDSLASIVASVPTSNLTTSNPSTLLDPPELIDLTDIMKMDDECEKTSESPVDSKVISILERTEPGSPDSSTSDAAEKDVQEEEMSRRIGLLAQEQKLTVKIEKIFENSPDFKNSLNEEDITNGYDHENDSSNDDIEKDNDVDDDNQKFLYDENANERTFDPNEDWCAVCNNGGDLLCCDTCPKVYHLHCHVPEIASAPPGTWQCTLCLDVEKAADAEVKHLKRKRAAGLSFKELKLCEKLLLEIYCHPHSIPFHFPVRSSVPNYYKVIKEPIDLSKIKKRLQPSNFSHYESVEELLTDVHLMFRNCFRFNSISSTIGKMGKKVEKYFLERIEKDFPQYLEFVQNLMKEQDNFVEETPPNSEVSDNEPVKPARRASERVKPVPYEHDSAWEPDENEAEDEDESVSFEGFPSDHSSNEEDDKSDNDADDMGDEDRDRSKRRRSKTGPLHIR